LSRTPRRRGKFAFLGAMARPLSTRRGKKEETILCNRKNRQRGGDMEGG
jgi:hypothetical protein